MSSNVEPLDSTATRQVDEKNLDAIEPHKVEYDHNEHVLELNDKPTEYLDAQLKSSLDNLTTPQAIKTFKRAALICLIAGFSAATEGYQNTLNGSVISNKGFIRHFSHGATKLNPGWVSAYTGCSSAGQVLGQFAIPFLSERIGRKGAMLFLMAWLTLAVVVEIVGKDWWHWLIAKIIAGSGIGAVQATLTPYINEHAPGQIRGFLLVCYSLWWSVGGLMAAVVLREINAKNPLNYKLALYTQFGVIGLSTIIFVFLPETPWWLARRGKVDQARKVLDRTYKGVPGYDSDREMGIILASIEQQRKWDAETDALGPFAMLKGLNLKRFLIGSYPKVLSQFVGLAVFSNQVTYFFQIASPGFNPFTVTIITSSVGLAATILDALLVDIIGRRRMTVIGFSGAAFGITLIAIMGCLPFRTNSGMAATMIFGGATASFFNTFETSTSYAYLTELPELRFRAKATGWGLAWCNVWAVIINTALPYMLKAWSVKCAFFFVCTGIPGTILAYFIMPESMQRSPAEIHELFTEGVNLRKWRGYKTQVEYDLEVRTERALQ